jgi:prepilin-type processing-associated H-X9-DG protein
MDEESSAAFRHNIDSVPNASESPLKFDLKSIFVAVTLAAVLACGIGTGIDGLVVAFLVNGVLLCIVAAWTRRSIFAKWGFVSAVIGMTAIVFQPAASRSPEAAGRNQCISKLKQIHAALKQYEHAHGNFPPRYTTDPNGKPLQSWRTQILPYCGEQSVYDRLQLAEAWDSSNNQKALRQLSAVFRCPFDKKSAKDDTSYLAVVGPRTAWGPSLNFDSDRIKDLLGDTIVIIELKSSGIKWAEPRDLDLGALPAGITEQNLPSMLSNHKLGFNALFADGHVEFIPASVPWSDLEAMFTIDGGEAIDRSKWEF